MKKIIFPMLLMLIAASSFAQTATPLKKTIELKMPLTKDDDMPGTRGACVVWHPIQKKYYAVFAGNAAYPVAVFDITGKRLSPDDLKALIDTRGLWYNNDKKLITGNAYSDNGWFTYQLDSKGIPNDYTSLAAEMNQPDAQCVGAYNNPGKKVLFLKGSRVVMYNNDRMPVDSVNIHWNRAKADGPGDEEDIDLTPEDFNYTTVVFTGIKGKELGFLNITNKEIELYDMKTGYKAQTLSLPETAIAESSFNFAYTNGTYWLFDMDKRIWKGYK